MAIFTHGARQPHEHYRNPTISLACRRLFQRS